MCNGVLQQTKFNLPLFIKKILPDLSLQLFITEVSFVIGICIFRKFHSLYFLKCEFGTQFA